MKLTVTEVSTPLQIPVGTKLMEIHNTGTKTIYRGWEAATTSTDDAFQGVPLAADKAIIYGGKGVPMVSGVLHLITAAGETSTLNYSFKA